MMARQDVVLEDQESAGPPFLRALGAAGEWAGGWVGGWRRFDGRRGIDVAGATFGRGLAVWDGWKRV